MNSISRIASRFGNVVLEVQSQIGFLKSKSVVRVMEIDELNKVLVENDVESLPTREHLGLPPHNLTIEEIQELATAFDRITSRVERQKCWLISLLDEIPADADTADPSAVVSWVDYLVEGAFLTGEETPDEIAELRKHTEQEWLAAGSEGGYSVADRQEILDEAYKETRRWRLTERVDGLQRILDRSNDIRIIAGAAEPNATMGVFRVGFITMMAAFDAAIFDLVRVALKRRFFELVGVFGRDKISMEELGELGTLEAVCEEIIDSQLKKRYIKDLLSLLGGEWHVKWLNGHACARFSHLIEFVLRRNLHLHNRGVVDQRYLDGAENPHALKLGELAPIDEPYWHHAKNLCLECVRHVAAWADGH